MALRVVAVWVGLAAVMFVPVIAAMLSPLLAWRDSVYIAAGLFGVLALALLLVQPLFALGVLPGLSRRSSQRVHRRLGAVLLCLILLHVAGLWLTSPPDLVDALLFRSPTPFSVWGVLALWAAVAAAGSALLRRRSGLGRDAWRRLHLGLTGLVVTGSVVHALLVMGTMEVYSKATLSACVVAAWIASLVRGEVRSKARRPSG